MLIKKYQNFFSYFWIKAFIMEYVVFYHNVHTYCTIVDIIEINSEIVYESRFLANPQITPET